MKKQRNQYAPEEKVAILRRHLRDKEPISKLCDEVGLQPTVFYRWQKEFFEIGASFEQKMQSDHSAQQERIAYLEKKDPDQMLPIRGNGSDWSRWNTTFLLCQGGDISTLPRYF